MKQSSASTVPEPWSWISFVLFLPRQLAQRFLNGRSRFKLTTALLEPGCHSVRVALVHVESQA